MNLVENIKALCETKGWSISELEFMLNFSRSSISKWDKNQPTVSRVLQVADLFNVSIEFLCKSDYYERRDLTELFISNLIKKTSEETIQWASITKQEEAFDRIRNASPLYDRYNTELYDYGEPQIDKDDDVSIFLIKDDENTIYFIRQAIYFCTMDDIGQLDDEYYYIALKEKSSKSYEFIIREPKKELMKKLYEEIKNSYYDKPKQKKFDDFIKKFIAQ